MKYKTYDDTSMDAIVNHAHKMIGRTFDELDKYERLDLNKANKGDLGQVIEESHFEYRINSTAGADFEHVGIELKVTPYKINKNKTISAKERLVLNIINYMEEYKRTFETSSFWTKNNKILLVFYEWQKEIPRSHYLIRDVMLNEFSEEDLIVIKEDWETIVAKIRAGLAHELSEADTNYLSACTKGSNRNSTRPQPFSPIPAMQRAFSLKASYMTALLRSRLGDKGQKAESILKGQKKGIEQLLYEKFSPYFGKSLQELNDLLSLDLFKEDGTLRSKSFAPFICSRILGIRGNNLDKIEEFSKANIKFKTIRIEKSGLIKEHMSFENFKYTEIINEQWEESTLRERFTTEKYLFVVFRYNQNDVLILEKIKLWNMPLSDLDNDVKATWEETVRIINDGVTIEQRGTKTYDNLPGSTFNGVCHTRPKGRDGTDKIPLPDGRLLMKKCFWLDRDYILKIVEN